MDAPLFAPSSNPNRSPLPCVPDRLPPALAQLLSSWSTEAQHLKKRGQSNLALFLESLTEEVENAWIDYASAALNLQEAAAESGYSVDHLGRQLLACKIPNAGAKGQPRIRRADLPRRVAARPGGKYDPDADARSLLTLRKEHT